MNASALVMHLNNVDGFCYIWFAPTVLELYWISWREWSRGPQAAYEEWPPPPSQ